MKSAIENPYTLFYKFGNFKYYLYLNYENKPWILIDSVDAPYLEAFKNSFDLKQNGIKKKYFKIKKLLDCFLNCIIDQNLLSNIYITGTFNFNSSVLKKMFGSLSSLKIKEIALLNKYFVVDFNFAKAFIEKKMLKSNLGNFDVTHSSNVMQKYAFNTFYQFNNNKNLCLFFSDFVELSNNTRRLNEEDLSWFRQGDVIYDLIEILIEKKQKVYVKLVQDLIETFDFEFIKFKLKIKVPDLITNSDNQLFLDFLIRAGLAVMNERRKIAFGNQLINSK